jgi:hypothetical protein
MREIPPSLHYDHAASLRLKNTTSLLPAYGGRSWIKFAETLHLGLQNHQFLSERTGFPAQTDSRLISQKNTLKSYVSMRASMQLHGLGLIELDHPAMDDVELDA